MRLAVKICGLTEPAGLDAAIAHGAAYVGFVFYPRSPRAISPALAADLARRVPTGVRAVGLFVDPDDSALDAVLGRVPLDLVQLHGGESPGRVAEITARTGLPAMKALRIASAADLDAVAGYEPVASRLLFDSAPPGATLPGGTGESFDWSILSGRRFARPWLLAGGLTDANLAAAVAATGAPGVDVSSGVESRPGLKSPDRIAAFMAVARSL